VSNSDNTLKIVLKFTAVYGPYCEECYVMTNELRFKIMCLYKVLEVMICHIPYITMSYLSSSY